MPVFMWLVLFPLIASPVTYFAGRIETRLHSGGQSPQRAARTVALITLLAMWVPLLTLLHDPATDAALNALGPFRVDGLGWLLAVLALSLGTLVMVYSWPYMATHTEPGATSPLAIYYALLLSMIGALIGLAFAHDLFNLWVWFEALAVSSYFLVGFYTKQRASLEASIKYLVQSAAGSVFILVAIALVLLQTGTLDLDQMPLWTGRSALMLIAGGLCLVGFGVKIALVPMHTWLPDAHAQAPSGISAMLSGVVIEAGLVPLLRVLAMLNGVGMPWGELLIGFGMVNIVIGNLLALQQTQVKRLLAFSSLSQVGYIVFGLGVTLYVRQPGGAEGAFFHLINHGLMKGLAFLAAGAILYALQFAEGVPLRIADLEGAAQRYPLVALTFSIALISLAGLPPLAGFMSKWQIFVAAFATGNAIIAGLVIIAALNSVLSLAYYMPIINTLYRRRPAEALSRGRRLPPGIVAPLALLAAAIVIIGVWPSLLQGLTASAGVSILAAFGR